MNAHDPLCPNGPGGLDQCFYCDLIARVHADLRAKVLGLPRGRDRESGLWCIEVDALLALLEDER